MCSQVRVWFQNRRNEIRRNHRQTGKVAKNATNGKPVLTTSLRRERRAYYSQDL
jgi:hypothetical protein